MAERASPAPTGVLGTLRPGTPRPGKTHGGHGRAAERSVRKSRMIHDELQQIGKVWKEMKDSVAECSVTSMTEAHTDSLSGCVTDKAIPGRQSCYSDQQDCLPLKASRC